jgi:RNA polymerase sigma-70 factor (ECF subfamily)
VPETYKFKTLTLPGFGGAEDDPARPRGCHRGISTRRRWPQCQKSLLHAQRIEPLLRIRKVAHDDQQLFERFRRHGDVGALGDLFDRVAPALLRLALHLSRDPAAAEDLLQSAFLRAIEVRDEWDGQRPLLPWLCGVLQNRAHHHRWQCGRAPDPARLAARPPIDPAKAAEGSEFDAAVDAAIAELPEPLRPVLRLHLAYGHGPAEIAHALERPPGTVRSQLARGLSVLRRVLPAGFAGVAALTFATGRGLAAVKQVVLGNAVVAVPAVVAGAMLGGVAVMKKVAMVVVVSALAAGAWFAWPKPDAAVPPAKTVDKVAQPAGASVPRPATAQAVSPPPTERLAVAAAQTGTTGSLRISCTWGDDGSPAWGVLVNVTPWAPGDGALLQRTVQTGDDGTALVANLPAGATWLEADRGGTLRVDVAAGTRTDAALVIPPGIDVRGRVVDETGAPVPAARVWLSEERRNYCDGAFVAATDQAGQFFLRSVVPERYLSATSPGRLGAGVQPVRGTVGTTVDLELVLCGAGVTLFGKVVAPDGASAVDARVFVGSRERGFDLDPDLFGKVRPPLELRTAADGTFAAHGLEAGSKQTAWVRAPGCCAWSKLVQLEAAGNTSIVVQLETGSVLAGRVTDVAGKPVAGTSIDYRSSAWVSGRADFDEGREPEWSHSHAQTDADGRYRIDCITPGTLRLRANKDKLEVRGEVQVAAGETAIWDPALVEIAIRGRVVDERGAPLAGVSVGAMPPRGKGNMASETTDAEGRFVCRRLAMVPYVLTFHAPGDRARVRPAASRYGVQPGSGELLVQLPDAAISKSMIVGRLLDADGRPPAKASVRGSTERMHGSVEAEVDAATGEFRFTSLPAGTWRLQAIVGEWSEHRRSPWSEPFALGVGATHDVGVMQMPSTGSIVVTATGPDGAPLDGRSVALEDSTGWSENAWLAGTLDKGTLRIDRIAPGDYRVRFGGERDLPTVYAPVTVTEKHVASVDLRVPKGVAVKLVLSPISEPVPMHEWFVWTRDGELFQRYENWWEGNGERTWSQRLLPGAYAVTITSETGKQESTRFVVDANDRPDRQIPIKMP